MTLDEAAALALLDARASLGMSLGLDRMRAMLRAADHPEARLRVVHVGGTNGKGSVAAMVASALTAAGHRTGLYTSPHLVRFHERIRIDGAPIPGAALARAMTRLRPVLDAFPGATYFEVATLLALRHFADERVDVVVVEVGMGGRLDATNVFERPLATAITNVSLDHTEQLGKTEESIATEKAGILRDGVPVVTGATGAALATIRSAAAKLRAPVRALGEEFVPIPTKTTRDGASFEIAGARELGPLEIALAGAHQIENAALAVALLDEIDRAGLPVPPKAVRDGLASARWPGRLQRIEGKPPVVLDGAHNVAGVLALVEWLKGEPTKPVLLFGALADKDWATMVELLVPHVTDGVVTRPPSPRALDPMEAARHFSRSGVFGITVDEPGHALRTARGIAAGREGGWVLVAGSLYLVGDALARLER